MPTEDSIIASINANGNRVLSAVTQLGFEIQTNSTPKALFFIATSRTFILVDQGAPRTA